MSDCIWSGVLDERWEVRVDRLSGSTGRLVVRPARGPGPPILDEHVPLSWGAVFGPDAGDVHDWQVRAMSAVDAAGPDAALNP